MTINTPDGHYSVTSKTQGNLNTFLGAAGTFLGLANGGMSLMGNRNGFGRGNDYNDCQRTPDSRYVTKGELDLIQQLMHKDQEIASKDSTIALKDSESYTDQKLVEVYANLEKQIQRVTDKMENMREKQTDINTQQAIYNATANSAIDVLKSQVAQIASVTKLYIPQANICHNGCGCGCNGND